MLLFSATIPYWVQQTADKYMSKDRVIVDLVGKNTVRTAVNVEVKNNKYLLSYLRLFLCIFSVPFHLPHSSLLISFSHYIVTMKFEIEEFSLYFF